MRAFLFILALLFALVVAVAAIINNEIVTVNYFLGQTELTLFMVILGSAFAGALVIFLLWLLRTVYNFSRSKGDRDYKKELQRRIKSLEGEKKQLEAEVKKQQKELENLAAKEQAELEKEKNKLEVELKKQQKELEQVAAKEQAGLVEEKKQIEAELKKQQKELDEATKKLEN